MKATFLALLSLFCSIAHAQVYRCTDAAGNIGFSDAPCGGKTKGAIVQEAPTQEQIQLDRLQAAEARRRFAAEQWEAGRPERERAAAAQAQRDARAAAQAERQSRRTVCTTSGVNTFGVYQGTTVCR